MGELTKLLQRANPANAANRSASQPPNSHDSHDSHGRHNEAQAADLHDLQPSHVLRRLREALRCAASAEGLPATLVAGLPDADVLGCDGCPADTLRSYLRILARSQHMAAGEVPEGWTQAAGCNGCGPVLLWTGAPAAMTGCPWCEHRKARRAIPRPRGGHLPIPRPPCMSDRG